MKLINVLILIGVLGLLGSLAAETYRRDLAVATVEGYTGETYHSGDCEALEVWESDSELVVNACEILE